MSSFSIFEMDEQRRSEEDNFIFWAIEHERYVRLCALVFFISWYYVKVMQSMLWILLLGHSSMSSAQGLRLDHVFQRYRIGLGPVVERQKGFVRACLPTYLPTATAWSQILISQSFSPVLNIYQSLTIYESCGAQIKIILSQWGLRMPDFPTNIAKYPYTCASTPLMYTLWSCIVNRVHTFCLSSSVFPTWKVRGGTPQEIYILSLSRSVLINAWPHRLSHSQFLHNIHP